MTALSARGTIMTGLAPDNRGLLPDSDVARLKEFGKPSLRPMGPRKSCASRIQRRGVSRSCRFDRHTVWSPPEGSHSATIELVFANPINLDRALTMEWLVDGQKVQKYAIQVMEKREVENRLLGQYHRP